MTGLLRSTSVIGAVLALGAATTAQAHAPAHARGRHVSRPGVHLGLHTGLHRHHVRPGVRLGLGRHHFGHLGPGFKGRFGRPRFDRGFRHGRHFHFGLRHRARPPVPAAPRRPHFRAAPKVDLPTAWELLSDGRRRAALLAFADLAEAYPTKGAPKVGYALAQALLCDLDRAAWAMRRALALDPDALHYVPVDPQLRRRLRSLRPDYRRRVYHRYHADPDAALMLAAVSYLIGDLESAADAVDEIEGRRYGGAASTRNLRRLIRQAAGVRRRHGR